MAIDGRAGGADMVQKGRIRVVVVDDHPIARRGVADVLGDESDFVLCGEAATAAAARSIIAAQQPHVAIVDLSLGNESGLDLVSSLAASHPSLRVLVLSAHDEQLYADRALKAGALGYIMKDQAAGELITAVRRVAAGRPYVSTSTADRILSSLGTTQQRRLDTPRLDRLSDRERHVLTLVGRGLATREIAGQLGLSVKTVESHYAHIKEKLGIHNGRELTRVAVTFAEGLR